MSRHVRAPDRQATAGRPAGAGHSECLDAWLDTDPCLVDTPAATSVGDTADWSAPTQPVALAYDTAEQQLPSSIRAVVREGSRRLMFEADDYEILLRVASNQQTEQHDLAGQVLFEGLPLRGATIRWGRGESSATTSTDKAGSFCLPPLFHGAYALCIAVDGAVLTTPPIALG